MSMRDDWLRKRIFRGREGAVEPLRNVPKISSPQFEHSLEPPSPSRMPYDTEPLELTVEEDPLVKLMEHWNVLCRHKILLVILTIVGALAGFAYNVSQAPRYQAGASMEIQDSQNAVSAIGVSSPNEFSIQTQVDILKSSTLLNRVISKMKPEKNPASPAWQDFLVRCRKALGVQPNWGLASWEEAVAMARKTLAIDYTRESRIITLRCQSTNPQVAAQFINSVAEEYIEQRLKERWEAYEGTSKWLMQAQGELKAKLELSEAELQRFARASGLVFTSDTQNIAEEKLKQLQTALTGAQAVRIAKQAQYEASKSGKPEALPEVLDNGPIGAYQVQLTELRRQLAELSSALMPEHYKIKRLQAQISELESVMERERNNVIKRIKNEYEAALQTENRLRSEYDRQTMLISGQAPNLIKYGMLKREAETNRQLYDLTLQKGKEASIASAMRASDARVIDPANPAGAPFKPVLAMNLAMGLIGGLMLGAAFALTRERLHANIHLTGKLPLTLSFRELGVIPSAKISRLPYAGAARRVMLPASRLLSLGSQLQVDHGERPENFLALTTKNQSNSPMAEAFRATMASILFSSDSNTGSPQAIVVTSPSPSEGKTTIACNLGIALAEINFRVLLLDADMRIPRLHGIFDIDNSWGLSNLLQDRLPIKDYLPEQLAVETDIPGLFVLPSGSARTNLSNLLYSPRLLELLNRCRCDFTAILIDAPPVLSVPDARILSRAADSVVLVFRAPTTTRDEASAAMKCLEEDGTPILGTILNDWDPHTTGYASYRSPYTYRYEAD
jgi:polysaccharide biosynthesis transport protein